MAPSLCPRYLIDFNSFAPGSYIHKDLKEDFGVTLTAAGEGGSGYTPNGSGRVTDSGVGGIDNVVIIQESDVAEPIWNEQGGFIVLSFDQPVHLWNLGVLQDPNDGNDISVTVVLASGGTMELNVGSMTEWSQINSEELNYISPDGDISHVAIESSGYFALTGLEIGLCPGSSFPSPGPSTTPTVAVSASPTLEDSSPPSLEPSSPPIFAPTEQPISFVCVDPEFLEDGEARREF